MTTAAFVWDPALTGYRLHPDHPFNPLRLELTLSLMDACGLLHGRKVFRTAPRPATEDDLMRVHDPDFVDAVKRLSAAGASLAEGARWGLGTLDTPVFPEMHRATSLVAGGTLSAAQLVMKGRTRRAFHIAGGLHHGHRDHAYGFCIYNDLAVAIDWIRERYDARVLYLDIDAHHGDGVQAIYYDDPDVLTFSIHETGRHLFPGTGFQDEMGEGDGYGFSVNVPLEPFTDDDSWLALMHDLVPAVTEAFRPDVIVAQFGCDGHTFDPLSHLRATTRLYEESIRLVIDAAERHCDGRLVVTGGGGYDIWRTVPRAWSLIWGAVSDQEVPDEVPESWIEQWSDTAPCELPRRMRDDPDDFPPVPRKDEIDRANARAGRTVRSTVLPLIRGWGFGF